MPLRQQHGVRSSSRRSFSKSTRQKGQTKTLAWAFQVAAAHGSRVQPAKLVLQIFCLLGLTARGSCSEAQSSFVYTDHGAANPVSGKHMIGTTLDAHDAAACAALCSQEARCHSFTHTKTSADHGCRLSFRTVAELKKPTGNTQTGVAVLYEKIAVKDSSPSTDGKVAVNEDQVPASAKTRPNIFIFVADDLNNGKHGLGFMGNPFVSTPALDAFAREGVQFMRMHTTMAMCAPARASLVTGLYPARNGVRANHMPFAPGTLNLEHYMGALGYNTLYGGKQHLHPRIGVQFLGQKQVRNVQIPATAGSQESASGSPFQIKQLKVWPPMLANDTDDPRSFANVVKQTAEARGKPASELSWCVIYGCGLPHGPVYRSADSPWVDFEKPLSKENILHHPKSPDALAPRHLVLPEEFSDSDDRLNTTFRDNTLRRILSAQFNAIEELDHHFALFLEAIHTDLPPEIMARSLVLFLTDHGHSHQSWIHGFAKYSCYNEGIRTPFVLQYRGITGMDPTPRRVHHVLSFVDVLPTFLELAGSITAEDALDGTSFGYLLRTEPVAAASNDADKPRVIFAAHTAIRIKCVTTPYPMRAATDGSWKYIRNFNEPGTMYQTNRANMIRRRLHDLWYDRSTNRSDLDGFARRTCSRNDYELLGPCCAHDNNGVLDYLYNRAALSDPSVFDFRSRPREELYNLDDDPGELVNLAPLAMDYARAYGINTSRIFEESGTIGSSSKNEGTVHGGGKSATASDRASGALEALERLKAALWGWMVSQNDTDPLAFEKALLADPDWNFGMDYSTSVCAIADDLTPEKRQLIPNHDTVCWRRDTATAMPAASNATSTTSLPSTAMPCVESPPAVCYVKCSLQRHRRGARRGRHAAPSGRRLDYSWDTLAACPGGVMDGFSDPIVGRAGRWLDGEGFSLEFEGNAQPAQCARTCSHAISCAGFTHVTGIQRQNGCRFFTGKSLRHGLIRKGNDTKLYTKVATCSCQEPQLQVASSWSAILDQGFAPHSPTFAQTRGVHASKIGAMFRGSLPICATYCHQTHGCAAFAFAAQAYRLANRCLIYNSTQAVVGFKPTFGNRTHDADIYSFYTKRQQDPATSEHASRERQHTP